MALVRRILGDAQAKLRKMVDEQVSVSARGAPEDEPEPADPLITPAVSVLGERSVPPERIYERVDRVVERSERADRMFDRIERSGSDRDRTDRTERMERRKMGLSAFATLDKDATRHGSFDRNINGDRDLVSRVSRLSLRHNNSHGKMQEEPPEEWEMNGRGAEWQSQNGSDSTYAEIGAGRYSALEPDSSEEELLGQESERSEPRLEAPSLDGEPLSPRSSESRHSRASRGSRGVPEEPPPSPGVAGAAQLARTLKAENERLQAELTRVRRLLVAAAERGEVGTALLRAKSDATDMQTVTEANTQADEQTDKPTDERATKVEQELLLAREAVSSLKADKKRLKAEKFDLLQQMKQLYATLEDKERELRDFIRNYEQMRSRGGASTALAAERGERERERAALLRHARDEAERSLQLAAALSARDTQLRHAREQLLEARRQLQAAGYVSECDSAQLVLALPMLDRGSCSDSGVRVTGSSDGGATSVCGGNLSDSTADGGHTTLDPEPDNISLVSSAHLYRLSAPRDCSPTLSPHGGFSRHDSGALSRSVEQLSSPGEDSLCGSRRIGKPARGRGSAWGSISRVFARSRHRTKSGSASGHESEPVYGGRAWSPLGGEAALREAAALPFARWRAPAIVAWMELALGMPQYAQAVADNVKSGKTRLTGQVLLELSDADLEAGLGVVQPMHRKKLRLAIEERRRPDLVRNPTMGQLSHAWVAAEWLPDLGLSQYAESFMLNLVDARMLDSISKKELEKYLGVTRKFHQASIVHGIHLLRIVKYDRQALAMRRHQCDSVDADPLVWTNQRFVRWAHSIDLAEYADNLKDSGVHGGLVVLEPSFTGDTMATALGIPPSKAIVRRHLVTEFDSLVIPARYTIFCQVEELQVESGRGFTSNR